MGAAGRDFHDFNVRFRSNPAYEIVAFTFTQIPLKTRVYPPQLAGPLYPKGIPTLPEEALPHLIEENGVGEVIFAYSDVSYEDVMHKASIVSAHHADFRLLDPRSTMLRSKRPVVSVCAVRTGCGKSQTTRRVCSILKDRGHRVVVVRHPMAYGDLTKQVCQRFSSLEDLDTQRCTIEEREEYESHIDNGFVVYAGVDYELILRKAEQEADVIIWDGGNNDCPFFKPDLHLVVVDPLRPGHELRYYPGEINLRMADVVIINKARTAPPEDVDTVARNVRAVNPQAKIIRAASEITVDGDIKGKRVLVVEDGPTLTHGGMAYGAGTVAAKEAQAVMVDPRPHAVGSLAEVYRRYPHLGPVLPAMGYSPPQIKELEQVINETECDVIVAGTPIDLRRVVHSKRPMVRVRYELRELEGKLEDVLDF